jgi:hypothetical protein
MVVRRSPSACRSAGIYVVPVVQVINRVALIRGQYPFVEVPQSSGFFPPGPSHIEKAKRGVCVPVPVRVPLYPRKGEQSPVLASFGRNRKPEPAKPLEVEAAQAERQLGPRAELVVQPVDQTVEEPGPSIVTDRTGEV